MGKTRDLFKKIGDIKGKFHSRLDMKMDRNYKDLTEAEDIKKRQQEYTEKLYKKGLQFSSVQFMAQSCPTLCDPKNRSMPGLPVQHLLPEFTQTHVH